jgi:hypothetical protein
MILFTYYTVLYTTIFFSIHIPYNLFTYIGLLLILISKNLPEDIMLSILTFFCICNFSDTADFRDVCRS